MKAMGTLKDELRLKKQNKGFTLTEILVVVAILLILLSVVLVSVVSLRRKLRQKELDGKAELVYLAAQNRISELRAGGYESLYLKTANGVTKLTLVPSDADDSETYDDPADDPYRNLYYVQSQDKQSEDGCYASRSYTEGQVTQSDSYLTPSQIKQAEAEVLESVARYRRVSC